MIQLIRQKIINQKWLSFCLILGMALLVAVVACQPMFKSGAMDRLLQQMFIETIEDENRYPTVLSRVGGAEAENLAGVSVLQAEIDDHEAIWEKYLTGVNVAAKQSIFRFDEYVGGGCYADRTNYLQISYMPDMLDHIRILKGTDYAGYEGDCIPCIMSEHVMDRRNHLVGEEITFDALVDDNGNPLKLVVAGIYNAADNTDIFWNAQPNVNDKEIFVSEEAFNIILKNYHPLTVYYEHAAMLDYHDIKSSNMDDIIYYLGEFSSKDADFNYNFEPTIKRFVDKRKSVVVMLFVLEIPILGMVLAFIYMVSTQIVESESGEIAMFKSRGISRFQVIRMYMLQSAILAVFAVLVGIPLGYGLCKLSASTTNFLTFQGKSMGYYRFVPAMLAYGAVAALVGILFVLMPVIKHSKISIVEQKSSYNQGKRMFWEKYFLDFLLLGVSLYLLYNFNQSIDNLRMKALEGNTSDPILFLNTCLFIIAFGLVVFRLVHYLVKFIYAIGRKKWKPVSYVAFLQITRTFHKQGFIAVFMILTVSLGLFNANAARTINRNNEDRIVYSEGADVVMQERWKYVTYQTQNRETKLRYLEPDYNKFDGLKEEGLCDSFTRVVRYDGTEAESGNKSVDTCLVFGIDTKSFGETAYLKDELNTDCHWYNYLNALGQEPRGVIISQNLAEVLGIKEGNVLNVYGMKRGIVQKDMKMTAKVVAVVENFPGYDRYYYTNGEQKERFLIVGNLVTMFQFMDTTPYEIWMKLSENRTVADIEAYMREREVDVSTMSCIQEQITQMKNTPDIQITNGMFTLSFIIALVLCGVGFLIYWVASIRKRELLFGVYRAMGLSVKNVNRMLIYEHIFSTFLSVIAGGVVGLTTTFLFIRLTCIVYLPAKSNLGIYIYYEPADMIKLFSAVLVMIIVCLLVLRRLISKMNITQALKLGED